MNVLQKGSDLSYFLPLSFIDIIDLIGWEVLPDMRNLKYKHFHTSHPKIFFNVGILAWIFKYTLTCSFISPHWMFLCRALIKLRAIKSEIIQLPLWKRQKMDLSKKRKVWLNSETVKFTLHALFITFLCQIRVIILFCVLYHSIMCDDLVTLLFLRISQYLSKPSYPFCRCWRRTADTASLAGCRAGSEAEELRVSRTLHRGRPVAKGSTR